MRAQACSDLLVSACARRMPEHHIHQLELCAIVHLSYNVCTAPLHANTTQSMPTQLCMQHIQTRRSAQSALSRSAAFSSFYSNSELIEKPMTRDSLCRYSCVHASTSLHKFACFWLRSSHARSSESSARVVRTLLVRLLCNVGTAPALANTTGSMPTQLCMRQLQMRWSAQSALSRSAASDCFLHAFLPAGEANNTWQPLPIQLHACEHKTSSLLVFSCACRMPDHHIHQLGLCALYSSTCAATFARRR